MCPPHPFTRLITKKGSGKSVQHRPSGRCGFEGARIVVESAGKLKAKAVVNRAYGEADGTLPLRTVIYAQGQISESSERIGPILGDPGDASVEEHTQSQVLEGASRPPSDDPHPASNEP